MKDKASGKKRREEEEQVHSTVERDLTDKAGAKILTNHQKKVAAPREILFVLKLLTAFKGKT